MFSTIPYGWVGYSSPIHTTHINKYHVQDGYPTGVSNNRTISKCVTRTIDSEGEHC